MKIKMFLTLVHLAKITHQRGLLMESINYNEKILKLVENNVD